MQKKKTGHPVRETVLANFSGLVDLLYRGVDDPYCWQEFLDSLSRQFGVRHSCLVVYKPGVFSMELRYGTPADILERYRNRYYHEDLFRLVPEQKGLMKTGAILDSRQYLKAGEIETTSFYRDILSGIAVDWCTLVVVCGVDEPVCPLIVLGLFHSRQETLSADAMKMLDLLQIHLRRVAMMRFEKEYHFTFSITHSQPGMICGQALVNTDGAIILANRDAADMFRSPVWDCRNGRLCLRNARHQRQLEVAMADALAEEEEQAVRLVLPRKKVLKIQVKPHTWLDAGKVCLSLLLLVQPDTATTAMLGVEDFAHHHRLTPKEFHLVTELQKGFSLKEIAERREVSFHTVRYQLARIFEKTGMRSQRELLLGILQGQ